ncbi:methionyl-tRNA formyltransferase [Aurantivibrio plasticivorans]
MQDISPLRVIFAGTPDFAAQHLAALIDGPHQIIAVYTQPDRPAGRGKKLKPSPVKQLAVEHDLPVYQPLNLKQQETQEQLAALNADIMIVVAYGLILPQVVLDTPRLGCINVHASLLPRWRGAAPIQRAIEAGDTETGVTIMQMDAGLDTGDMLKKIACPIQNDDTSTSLFNTLAALGSDSINNVLDELAAGKLIPEPQDNAQANYAEKISKAEADINWQLTAEDIARKVRAFNPFPIAFTHSNNERIKIHKATALETSNTKAPGTILEITPKGLLVSCSENALLLEEIQLPGKKAMTPHAILLGNQSRFNVGDQFTCENPA